MFTLPFIPLHSSALQCLLAAVHPQLTPHAVRHVSHDEDALCTPTYAIKAIQIHALTLDSFLIRRRTPLVFYRLS